MSKFDEFRRLSGLQTYLPTLKEAKDSDDHLDVGNVPSMLGDVSRAMELATSDEVLEGKKMREMKLGVAGGDYRDAVRKLIKTMPDDDTSKDKKKSAQKAEAAPDDVEECGCDDEKDDEDEDEVEEGIFDRFTGGTSKGMKVTDRTRSTPSVPKRTARDPMAPAAAVGYDAKAKKKPVPKGKLNPGGGFYERRARMESAETPDEQVKGKSPAMGKTKFQQADDAAVGEYYKLSGMAHHAGHQAHALTGMTRSGEASHDVAHDAHKRALDLHSKAYDAMKKTSLAHGAGVHGKAIADHEKHMTHHGKKSGKY